MPQLVKLYESTASKKTITAYIDGGGNRSGYYVCDPSGNVAAGTGTMSRPDGTNMPGFYTIVLAAAEVDEVGNWGVVVADVGVLKGYTSYQVVPFDPYSPNLLEGTFSGTVNTITYNSGDETYTINADLSPDPDAAGTVVANLVGSSVVFGRGVDGSIDGTNANTGIAAQILAISVGGGGAPEYDIKVRGIGSADPLSQRFFIQQSLGINTQQTGMFDGPVTRLKIDNPGSTATTTTFKVKSDTDSAPTVDSALTGMRCAIVQGGSSNYKLTRCVTGYVGSTKTVTIPTPLVAAPADNDLIVFY